MNDVTTKEIETAVTTAVNGAVTTALKDTVTTAVNEAVPKAVLDGFKEDQKKKFDPFRSAMLYLVGLIAFCLTVIVGLFAAMSDFATWKDHALATWLIGSVLAWVSLAALAATTAMLILQVWKAIYFYKRTFGELGWAWAGRVIQTLLMAAPLVLGGVAVSYCVRVGHVLRSAELIKESGTQGFDMPGFMTALCALF